MARNLKAAIIASGFAGTVGQSFKNHVTGAVSGDKLSDWLVSAWASWTGEPAAPSAFTIYPNGQAFALVGTVTRGPRASNIQQLTAARFTAGLTPQAGSPSGYSVVINSVTNTGTGGVFTINVTVTSANTGSMVGSVTASPGSEPASGDPWSWTLWLDQTGVSGETDFWLDITYNPDTGGFSAVINNFTFNGNLNGWPLRLANRGYESSELSFRWWDNASDAASENVGTIISTATQLNFTTYTVGDNVDRWVRWRYGAGAWSAAIALSTAESRLI